jgi:RNA polymerase sigma-70 factor (ECF subfamily)
MSEQHSAADRNQHEQFMQLYAQHDVELRRYVLTLVADRTATDDIMQETVIALWRKFDTYQPDRPFLNWAYRFAYYEVLKHRKRQKLHRRFFSAATVDAVADTWAAEHDALHARREALRACLEKLPPGDRDLIGLRYASDATVASTAAAIQEPAKKLYRALERIRRVLMQCMNRQLRAEGSL